MVLFELSLDFVPHLCIQDVSKKMFFPYLQATFPEKTTLFSELNGEIFCPYYFTTARLSFYNEYYLVFTVFH